MFERPGDKQFLPDWVAALDLAYTLVLMGSPDAAAALDRAAARRPPGAPAGHPLDAVQAYLRERLQAGADDAAGVQAALRELRRAQGRGDGTPAGAGLGSLGGAFI